MLASSFTFKITKFLRRYSVTIFIVLVTLGLIYAVYSITHIATDSASISTDSSTNDNTQAIDQATVNKINALHSVSESGEVSLPSGRVNPFSE